MSRKNIELDETLLDLSKLTDLGKASLNYERQRLMEPDHSGLREFYNYLLILASKEGVYSEFKRARAWKQLATIMKVDLKNNVWLERWEIFRPYLDESGAWKRPLTFYETDDARAERKKEKDTQNFIKNDERKQEEKKRRDQKKEEIRKQWGLIKDKKPKRGRPTKAKVYYFPASARAKVKGASQ